MDEAHNVSWTQIARSERTHAEGSSDGHLHLECRTQRHGSTAAYGHQRNTQTGRTAHLEYTECRLRPSRDLGIGIRLEPTQRDDNVLHRIVCKRSVKGHTYCASERCTVWRFVRSALKVQSLDRVVYLIVRRIFEPGEVR